MKEFEGTKGKWSRLNSMVMIEGEVLADVYCGKGGSVSELTTEDQKEMVANAQLIATAPELLEALQKAICYVPIDEEDFDDFARVINKALGKEK